MPSAFDSNSRDRHQNERSDKSTRRTDTSGTAAAATATSSPSSSTSIEGTTERIADQQQPPPPPTLPSSSSSSLDTNHYSMITPAEYIYHKSTIMPTHHQTTTATTTTYEPLHDAVGGRMGRREEFASTKREQRGSSGRFGMGGGGGGGGGEGSFMSMGCSGRSLLSMDLALRSQDFEGGFGSLLRDDDDDVDDFRDFDDAASFLPDYRDMRRDGSLSDVSEFCETSRDRVDAMTTTTTSATYAERPPPSGPLECVIEDRRMYDPAASSAKTTTENANATANAPCPVLKLTARLERVSTCGSVDLLNENFRVTSNDWGMPVHKPLLVDDVPMPILPPLRRPVVPPPIPSSSLPHVESTPSMAGAASSSIRERSSSTPARREVDMSRSIEPTDDDVLLGRGGFTNTHPGNIRFRDKALELRSWYEKSDKEQKFAISKILLESVTNEGHSFLERKEDGLWYEVVGDGARKKASQALRERIKGSRRVNTSA